MGKIKKSKSKKLSTKRQIKKVREKFSSYEEKLDRLKQFESELKKMDTRGFSKEVSVIKAQLNDPTSIQEIDRRINDLKRKILIHKKRKSPFKEIKKSIHDIATEGQIEGQGHWRHCRHLRRSEHPRLLADLP